MAKLGDIFTLQMGKTPARAKEEYWNNGDNNWVSISDLSTYSKYVGETKETISDLAVKESGIKPAPTDTVIMSFKLTLGKTAITVQPTYTNEAIMAFIPNGNYPVHPSYFYHFFGGRDWSKGTNRAVMGTTLNKATLSEIEVSVPTLAEQIDIAERLDKVDTLISQRQQQLSKIDELVKSRFIELFGDLASPCCQWKTRTLIETCVDKDDIKCGPFGTQLSKDEYQSCGVAVWEIPQINNRFTTKPTHYLTQEKAQQLSAYSIVAGDIAMSRKGNVGKCAIFPADFQDGIIHSDVLRIRVDTTRVLPIFMMYQLHYSKAVQHQIELVSSGAIMAGINVTKLKQILVHIPPMELQNEFATFVEQTDKLKFDIIKRYEKIGKLKKICIGILEEMSLL